MQNALSRREKILHGLIIAFIGSLFLPDMPVIANIILASLLGFTLFQDTWKDKMTRLTRRTPLIIMTVFMILQLASALLSADKNEGLKMWTLRLPLLLFPLSIGLTNISTNLKLRCMASYTLLMTLLALICTGYACSQWRHTGDSGWLYDDSLTYITRQQSIYVAQAINLAIFFLICLLHIGYPIRKTLAYPILLFLLLFHFLLASRIAIITLYTALFIYLLQNFISQKKYKTAGALVIAIALLAGGLPILFPKTVNRFRELRYTGYQYNSQAKESHYNMALTPDQWNGANIRLAIWSCGIDIAKQHWLTGIPLGDKQKILRDTYAQRGFTFALRSNRNMHSTYLDVLVNMGIIGLIGFILAYLITPIRSALRAKDAPGAFLTISLAAAMLTETWIDRSLGCMLIGLWYSLSAAWNQKSKSQPK